MARPKVLLVDDNASVLEMMQQSLHGHGFDVVPANGVTDTLNLIVSQRFDVLITDLHMPNAGDGFAVVTAMHHAQPEALTLVVSGFPDVQEAMAAILLHADEVVVKPFEIRGLVELIRKRTQERKQSPKPFKRVSGPFWRGMQALPSNTGYYEWGKWTNSVVSHLPRTSTAAIWTACSKASLVVCEKPG
jgi:DNA-binding NtrC family response regulator